MQPYSFLAALPALLGLAGFVLYQVLGANRAGDDISRRVVDKLRREVKNAPPDQRMTPRRVANLLDKQARLREIVGEQDFHLLKQALTQQFVLTIVVYILTLGFCALSVYLFVRPSSAAQENITAEILRQARSYQELSEQYRGVKEELTQHQNVEAQAKITRLERELTEIRTGINQKAEALEANPMAYGGVDVTTVSTQAIQAWKSCVNAAVPVAGIPVGASSCYEILKQGLDVTKKTTH
jgi:hypothetical protein